MNIDIKKVKRIFDNYRLTVGMNPPIIYDNVKRCNSLACINGNQAEIVKAERLLSYYRITQNYPFLTIEC